ncbi:MAG TPA: HEAT repeat domain-containing protein, partial [Candidatus Obscuribacterales bacterium]
MAETRKRNSVRVNEGGKQKLIEAKAAKRNEKGRVWTYFDIATAASVSEKTVKRFFAGEECVDEDYAVAIANALGLKLTELVDPKDPPPPPPEAINWREVCGKVLAKQRLREKATEWGFELNVYVQLGLVERKQQQRRDGDVACEEVYQLDKKVITKEYQHDKFLEEVIGKSDNSKGKHIAIIGEPGAGKTTRLSKIASWIQENEKGLPICIPLAGLEGKTIEEYLCQKWLKQALPFIDSQAVRVTSAMEEELIKLFHRGKVWLLLDGVDELGASSPVAALNTIKKQVTGWVASARVVLTCRLNVWDASVNNKLTDFDTYRTLEFEQQQVSEFIQQWFACAEKPDLATQLLTKLNEPRRERIRGLVKNPLRLALLCQTWYLQPDDLPKTKAELYQRFTRYFYEWKQEQHYIDTAGQKELNAALSQLALEGMKDETARFRLRESLALQVMGASLFQKAGELGWLNLVDRDAQTDEPVYAFFHPTFQEYFAALAIDDWHFFLNHKLAADYITHVLADNLWVKSATKSVASYRIFEPQWKEVILLWLGRDKQEITDKQKQQFIQALVKFEDGCENFYGDRAYFLAAAGISEVENFPGASEIVKQIVKWGFGYFDIEEDRWVTFLEPGEEGARATLPQTERSIAISELVQLITSTNNVFIPSKAASILEKIGLGNPTAISALVQLITSTNDLFIRREAASILGKIDPGNPTAISALVQLITETNDESTRREAASSLGKIDPGNLTAISALVQLITSTNDEYTRREAASSLGKIDPGNPTAISALVQLIT